MADDEGLWNEWYRRLFPEVYCFSDLRQGKRVLWDYWHNAYGILWLLMFFYPVCLLVILLSSDRTAVVITYLLIPASLFVSLMLLRARIRRQLRRKLKEIGIPVCLACGYDLRGSPGRCPECGTEAGA